MNINKIIVKIRNTRDVVNLKKTLGDELGGMFYKLIEESEKADKELDILHSCITDLWDIDNNASRITEALDDINELKRTK